MTYREISIPGQSTRFGAHPHIEITGVTDGPVNLTIRFQAGPAPQGSPAPLAEVTFSSVLEYRWVANFVEYYPYDDSSDLTFGLIEILDSRLIEDMAAKGPWKGAAGARFGPTTRERDVRHFRLTFDEYGRFDVVALGGVEVRQL